MKGFKKCANGHWYKEDLAQCPYPPCTGQGNSLGNNTLVTDTNSENEEKTGVFSPRFSENADNNKTMVVGEKKPIRNVSQKANVVPISSNTQYEEEFEEETESGSVVVKKEQRSNRRLVGWLVTYSIDPLGIDYKIYEGRNLIGRDADCQITVNDKKISGKHAIIVFRADKYKIKDELSSHGTFVNGEDIEEETVELHDGDIIKLGDTVFKFKTSF
jgi:hypothetical protein